MSSPSCRSPTDLAVSHQPRNGWFSATHPLLLYAYLYKRHTKTKLFLNRAPPHSHTSLSLLFILSKVKTVPSMPNLFVSTLLQWTAHGIQNLPKEKYMGRISHLRDGWPLRHRVRGRSRWIRKGVADVLRRVGVEYALLRDVRRPILAV